VYATLGTDPVSRYGITEIGFVAWQCERREGFHVNAEAYLVEVVRDGRPAAPGEVGALVVTDVWGRARPLLRYDTGDLAVAGDGNCPCGRSLPAIASIEGRTSESALLADGRVVTTRTVVDALAGTLRPGEFHLHQEGPDRFRVMLAERAGRDAVVRRLLSLLGDVELQIEAGVPPPPAGAPKTRAVSSDVPFSLSAPPPRRSTSRSA
jgi:phenylacetate-CoA ligase